MTRYRIIAGRPTAAQEAMLIPIAKAIASHRRRNISWYPAEPRIRDKRGLRRVAKPSRRKTARSRTRTCSILISQNVSTEFEQ